MKDFIASIANAFSDVYAAREEERWQLADLCAYCEPHPNGLRALREELEEQHGISVTLQTLKNYAQVSKSFAEEHRHCQYKWSNYLAWSKWEDPIKAMEIALDNCYSPRQMDNLRKHGDPNYKEGKTCEGCGKPLTKGHVVCEQCLDYADELTLSNNPEFIAAAKLIVEGLEKTEIDFTKVRKCSLQNVKSA